LFAPIERYLNSKLWVEPGNNPFLKGNFAPVDHEHSYEMIDIIAGEVPKDINGVYLRNGPNPKFFPKNNRHHAFDGDSMIHAIRLKQGKINYCNKMTRTPKFL